MYSKDIKKNILNVINKYKNKKIFELNIQYNDIFISKLEITPDRHLIISANIKNYNKIYYFLNDLSSVLQYLIYLKLLEFDIYNYVDKQYYDYSISEKVKLTNKIYINTIKNKKIYKKSKITVL